LKGCETPVLVLFTNNVEGEMVEQYYSRCQTKLIIVREEKQIREMFPSGNDSISICDVIPVFGMFLELNLFLLNLFCLYL